MIRGRQSGSVKTKLKNINNHHEALRGIYDSLKNGVVCNPPEVKLPEPKIYNDKKNRVLSILHYIRTISVRAKKTRHFARHFHIWRLNHEYSFVSHNSKKVVKLVLENNYILLPVALYLLDSSASPIFRP